MKTLLAVDGSENSYEAARALAYLSRGEEVTVVHALDVPKAAYPTMVPEAANKISAAVEKRMREDGEHLLDRIVSLLPADTGPVSRRMEVGTPADVIAAVAQQQRADLIVMGARGHSTIKERLLGSVSHRVLSMPTCSKLIVNRPIQAIRRILLALQGPDDADVAVRFLASNPFREPVVVTIVTVVPFAPPLWPSGVAVAEEIKGTALLSAQDFVNDVACRLTGPAYNARGLAMIASPVQVILNEATRVKPDLILMGSRVREGVTARFVLGSTSHAVLHQAGCPVLIFH